MSTEPQEKRRGRPVGSTSKLSAKQSKLKKLLLSELEPHVAEAMQVMLTVMRSEQEKGQTRMLAAKYVLDQTQELIEKILTPEKDGTESDDDEENKSAEVLEMKPKLRLTVSENN